MYVHFSVRKSQESKRYALTRPPAGQLVSVLSGGACPCVLEGWLSLEWILFGLTNPSFKRICCACQNVTASPLAPTVEHPPTLHPRHHSRLQDRCVSFQPLLVACGCRRDDFYHVRSSKVWKPNSLTSSIRISFPASLSSSKSTVTVRTNKSTYPCSHPLTTSTTFCQFVHFRRRPAC